MRWCSLALFVSVACCGFVLAQEPPQELFLEPIDVNIPHVSTDPSVRYDYDIVYVRADRAGDVVHKRYYTDFSQPVTMEPGADLMLLHADGSEELLVDGGKGSITDPVVSFDGQSVYYVHIHNLEKRDQWSPPAEGADIYKIHLGTRKLVRLTNQQFTPNHGAAEWTADYRPKRDTYDKSCLDYGVFNMGPYPLPGGRIVFTSNRDGVKPAKGYPAIALQLFVMDDRDESIGDEETPRNLEKIGHLNLAGALHPVTLKDGRIMYSTLESQGARSDISWGIWTIHPDGTNWAPLVSAFDPGGASNGFHFQTQLSDGNIIVEEYYNQNNSGFGTFIKLPPSPPEGYQQFGPAKMDHARNRPWRFGRNDNGMPRHYRMPFMPTGSECFTPFAFGFEGPADHAIRADKNSPAVGKVTHPSGAPDNHCLTVYSPGPVNHQYTYLPQLDGGIYLIKRGAIVSQPAQMRLIKNDPRYNESWPRAVVPYQRIYGIPEPVAIPRVANDGKASKHLPEGTPFGLVGTSSFYKRETFPNGEVPEGSVTSIFTGKDDPWCGLEPFTSHGNGIGINWHNQGADAGLYSNEEIHAVRILAMESTTDRKGARHGRLFFSHANERLRVLGEIPLRKFAGGKQPLDPDGNPDTSFLARIPADVAFTLQTLDVEGCVLNSAQTWHQLRPGEVRVNCGGCHAHSQEPTDFSATAAAKDDYQLWDLTMSTPIVSEKSADESQQQWDTENRAGLRQHPGGPLNVEYHRDIKPILARSCAACHTSKDDKVPAGKLDLDADGEQVNCEHHGTFPGTYARLAMDERAAFGHKPIGYDSWGYPNASRYIRKFQSRRSLLVWKIFGERLDGFTNDDHPSESKPGERTLTQRGAQVDPEKNRSRYDLDFSGSPMPPASAVEAGKVQALSDEDRRTLVRWVDLGCPIDLDYDASQPERTGYGYLLDDQRPTLALTYPQPGENNELTRIVIGLFDYGSGLNEGSLRVTADFEIDGVNPGENLSARFQPTTSGVRAFALAKPLSRIDHGRLTVEIADKQGNLTRIERRFSVREK